MAFVFAGLAKATPAMLGASIVLTLAGIIILGVSGMAVLSMLLGKRLGYTKEMAFAVALTALYGFLPSLYFTEEASKALAETKEENEFLMDQNAAEDACRRIYYRYDCLRHRGRHLRQLFIKVQKRLYSLIRALSLSVLVIGVSSMKTNLEESKKTFWN